jgi:non-ribosomal peptide synthetase component F
MHVRRISPNLCVPRVATHISLNSVHFKPSTVLESFCSATELNSERKALLMSTPAGFDISLVEIWASIAHGVTAVVTPHIEIHDWWFEGASRACRALDVGFVQGVPSVLQGLLDAGLALPAASVVSCGDVLTPTLASQLRERFARVYNGYGPTETHYCTIYRVPDATLAARLPDVVPIGRPLSNASALVVRDDSDVAASQLDDASHQCKLGEAGLLYVGGETVAIGYVGRPDETAAKFIDTKQHGRVYATGDRVRWNADNQLEYIGRRDMQLNAGGLRVEAGEIEAPLMVGRFCMVLHMKNKRLFHIRSFVVENNWDWRNCCCWIG